MGDKVRRSTRWTALTTGATVLAMALLAAPASATDFDPPTDTTGPAPTQPEAPPSSGDDYAPSGPSYGQVKNCSVVSTPNYIGLSCGSGGGEVQTVKEY